MPQHTPGTSSGSSPRWLDLEPGEVFLRSAGANRSTRAVAAGGWLALTSERLVHHTHAVEKALTRTQDWSAALDDVAGAEVLPASARPGEAFTGGVRRRLAVVTRDGREAVFVVNGVDGWRSAVDEAFRAHPAAPDAPAAGAPDGSPARGGPQAPETQRGLWRRYWCRTVPLVTSVFVSMALGLELLVRALGLGDGFGALGGSLVWLGISLRAERPGAQERDAHRRTQSAGRHTSGVVSVERPPPSSATSVAETLADPPAEPDTAARARAVAATWALLLVAVDATVVVVLLTTDEWGPWVTAVAVALLATHLWLAARTLRGPRSRCSRRGGRVRRAAAPPAGS